jgi:hypothetical protein
MRSIALLSLLVVFYVSVAVITRSNRPARLRSTLGKTTGPLSSACRQFSYERYFRATTFQEMRELGRNAIAGDMIELVAGLHTPHHAPMETTDGEGLCSTWPTRALEGTVFELHGRKDKLITFCGDRDKTIIDGGKNNKGGAGIQVVKSSFVRFAGFTIRNLLRAVDLQDTMYSEILNVTGYNTWHEGWRIRYNSSHNLVQNCHIHTTGRGYVGNGEGIYIGTARGRTVDCGNPEDQSNYNIISRNVFGPNVPSENVDVKEFTTGGTIVGNQFNGTDLRGIHASTSWIALKGKNYTIENNVGVGLGVDEGAGIRVLQRADGFGNGNLIKNNTCRDLSRNSWCVFVDKRTSNNVLENNAIVDSQNAKGVSNV